MALIQRTADGLFLVANSGPNYLDWGVKRDAIKRHRLGVEQAIRYAEQLRAAGHNVRAVTDNGENCEPAAPQAFTPVNQAIDYGDADWRITFRKASAGYIHEWSDSDSGQPLQIVARTPQELFEKLRDFGTPAVERHISELPRVAPIVVEVASPQPAQQITTPALRPGDARNYVDEQPVYRSYYNPSSVQQQAALRPEAAFAQWEKTASVAELKRRFATDPAFAAWYDGVAVPRSNR